MSKPPPRRGERPSTPGSTRPSPSSSLPPKTNRAPSTRRQPQYEPEEQYEDQYYEEQYYDDEEDEEYEPAGRPYRAARQGPRSGPPPRRRQAAYYEPPRRDIFPILIGAMVGMLVVGIMIVLFLVFTQRSTTTSTAANTTNSNDASTGNPTSAAAPTMGQSSNNSASVSQTLAAVRPADGIGTAVPDEGNAHVDEGQAITYVTYPPVSGTHYGSTAEYGFSDAEVPEGKLVHSLEHGAIVIYYKPDVPDAVKQQLREALTKLPAGKYGKVKLTIAPYSKMTAPIALAAWDRLFLMNEYNYDEVQTFYTTWVDKGPEDVP
jgi:hypothetical protein